ncbi:TauD/TfdA family dioxygenase [Paractinoplanes atraurantiacus]|uniref:Arginine beta-hydroxylase, Fe(II)/alpha-ketoglutarate-dependent n=1 Tax=Paractinoplanes atraurantiacus TaxID=1036182 RepID=A0A285J2I4_9ACTN|nr:TauD/TfdA family dioxygenase [Actinoplanes atraurantiacus]SNY53576.1 arginine beta-hydroxylase, Fe(II)/alpha-ketoglutarate-dependent [Actinoplanes atraurantiacus]
MKSSTITPPRLLHVCRLDDASAGAAGSLALACLAEYGSAENPAFMADLHVLAADLPRPVREAAARARLDERKHAVVFRGNHIAGDLEPTPAHWKTADTPSSRRYAILLALYAGLFGDPIGWAAQQAGHLITDVLPVAGMEESTVSSSSGRELAWHTEDAFSPHRAHHVGLLALRNPDQVDTTIGYVDLPRLSAAALETLFQPRFEILPDDSHEGADQAGGEPTPLLTGHPEAPVLRVDRDFARPVAGDRGAAAAWAELTANIDNSLYGLAIGPGDICFLDNRNVVHGRRSFLPRYDGTDRWLKRVNVITDLRSSRPARPSGLSRIIH